MDKKLFDILILVEFNKKLENGNITIAIFLTETLIALAIIVPQVVK